jgi:hypothetical protein
MPYKSEKILIAGTRYDKRRKLSQDSVSAIKILISEGYSYRQLAAMFHCSKWTIQNIIHPPIRGVPQRRTTAYWTEKKREYRQRKQFLFKSGKIHDINKRKSAQRKRKDNSNGANA